MYNEQSNSKASIGDLSRKPTKPYQRHERKENARPSERKKKGRTTLIEHELQTHRYTITIDHSAFVFISVLFFVVLFLSISFVRFFFFIFFELQHVCVWGPMCRVPYPIYKFHLCVNKWMSCVHCLQIHTVFFFQPILIRIIIHSIYSIYFGELPIILFNSFQFFFSAIVEWILMIYIWMQKLKWNKKKRVKNVVTANFARRKNKRIVVNATMWWHTIQRTTAYTVRYV